MTPGKGSRSRIEEGFEAMKEQRTQPENEMRGKNDKTAMGPTEQNRNDH
jgi:hypothetical protein